jgi:hypothetical protein
VLPPPRIPKRIDTFSRYVPVLDLRFSYRAKGVKTI